MLSSGSKRQKTFVVFSAHKSFRDSVETYSQFKSSKLNILVKQLLGFGLTGHCSHLASFLLGRNDNHFWFLVGMTFILWCLVRVLIANTPPLVTDFRKFGFHNLLWRLEQQRQQRGEVGQPWRRWGWRRRGGHTTSAPIPSSRERRHLAWLITPSMLSERRICPVKIASSPASNILLHWDFPRPSKLCGSCIYHIWTRHCTTVRDSDGQVIPCKIGLYRL